MRNSSTRNIAGTTISAGILICASVMAVLVEREVTLNPRTDDAEVVANFIGIAPVVSGPIVRLQVRDNELVASGQALFDIDDSPYRYALAKARGDVSAVTGQLADEQRLIAAKRSGVYVAQAGFEAATSSRHKALMAVSQALEEVNEASAALARTESEARYAESTLRRIEPLLAKEYVTQDQVDQLRSLAVAKQQDVSQARARLAALKQGVEANRAQVDVASATVVEGERQVQQATHSITTLEPLEGQMKAKLAAVELAKYDYDHCHVAAPFPARVTNLTISQGAYAQAGQQIFTLIDDRTWWVIANFRETQLGHIRPGMHVDVFVLSRSGVRLRGVVESIGYGVTPDSDLVGRLNAPGLPDVQRTLNWVHLASRYPVRIRIYNPPPELLRLSESATVVIRGKETLTVGEH